VTVPIVQFVVAGAAQPSASSGRPYTLVYDGACRMCSKIVKTIDRWDGADLIEAVPFQAPGVQARFPWIPAGAYRDAVQFVGPGGATSQGAAAVEQLLNTLPRGRLLSWLFLVPGARGVAERIYRWVARNRYRLGCGEHCQFRPDSVTFPE